MPLPEPPQGVHPDTCQSPPFRLHDHASDAAERRDAHRALLVSALVLFVAGAAEVTVSLLGRSVGLLSDGFHNLADVSTSAVVFLGLRLSKRAPSRTHPYGWDRAEDLAGLGIALVIWMSAVLAGWASIYKLVHHGSTGRLEVGMAAAAVGVLANLVVARYKLVVGRRIRSVSLTADARHSWLDAVSSVGALLGLVGVALGARWADPLAGILITLFIIHVGIDVTGSVLHHLNDGIEPDVLETAVRVAEGVDGVTHAHARGRWTGRCLTIEVDASLGGAVSLAESDRIGELVVASVKAALPAAKEVLWVPRAGANRPS